MTEWRLDLNGDYTAWGWWDYLVYDDGPVRVKGVYRLTEHGWWDVRTIFFKYDVITDTGNTLYLPATERTEAEVRKIVEAAWILFKGEQ